MNFKTIEFDNLVDRVSTPLVGQERLAIWGGTCAEDALADFLAGWSLERMSHCIWESTDRIDLGKHIPVPNVILLERGRLFGKVGDLDLRRDGNTFRWRFVGDPGIHPPASYDVEENNFWAQHPGAAFHCYEEKALLWGKLKDDRWHDDRVAAAKLDYPKMDGAERVQVKYKVYSRAGRVEFVWLTKLCEWKEENDG